MYEETIIGFDAREMELSYVTNWPQERRERFLLRDDLTKPLSIEGLVWPSIFLSSKTFVEGKTQNRLSNSDVEIPLQYRSLDNLWRDLNEMRRYLSEELKTYKMQYWEIAITEVMNSSDHDQLISTGTFVPSEVS